MGRAALAVAAALVAAHAFAPQKHLTPSQYEQDFDAIWEQLRLEYAYFDKGLVDWEKARRIYRPKLAQVTNMGEFVFLLESLIDQLCDPHTHLNTNTGSSQRLVPTGARVWAEMEGSRVFITDVRDPATKAALELKAGDEILKINGMPVVNAIGRRIGPAAAQSKPAVKQHALMCLLAGVRDRNVTVTIRSKGKTRELLLAPADSSTPQDIAPTPLISSRLLPNNIGYIKFNNCLGDPDTVSMFDAALASLRQTKGLILDLRDTPGGGNTVVARGIMGRLIAKETPYQKHVDPGEQRATGVRHAWVELVSPRGAFTYSKPVVVLVSRWTASMGEGIAIGLSGMNRATVVGTRMAGLVGSKRSFQLPNAGFSVSYAAEKLFTVNGTPREDFIPDRLLDLAKLSGSDPILSAGLKALK